MWLESRERVGVYMSGISSHLCDRIRAPAHNEVYNKNAERHDKEHQGYEVATTDYIRRGKDTHHVA